MILVALTCGIARNMAQHKIIRWICLFSWRRLVILLFSFFVLIYVGVGGGSFCLGGILVTQLDGSQWPPSFCPTPEITVKFNG